jgi:hypothetical protein
MRAGGGKSGMEQVKRLLILSALAILLNGC